MSRKKTLALMIITLLLQLVVPRTAHAQYQANIRLPSYELYAPAKIIVNFVYTNNVSVRVSTLGTTLYKATTSPVQVIFEAEAFDLYTITVDIYYITAVNQTIVIGLFEGGRAAKGMEVDVVADHISLTMRVSVIEAPRIPTAEEISDAIWARWQSALDDFKAENRVLTDRMGETMAVVGGLAVIAFVVCMVSVIAVFRMNRKVAELSEWGIRHEHEHRKGGG